MNTKNNFIYWFRVIDLKKKYFGDIVSEEVICSERNKEVVDEVVQNILKQYKGK